MHKDEGATRLQEVEADSLVAVAKLDEDNPLACRRWQARMCPSWVSTHWHILSVASTVALYRSVHLYGVGRASVR